MVTAATFPTPGEVLGYSRGRKCLGLGFDAIWDARAESLAESADSLTS